MILSTKLYIPHSPHDLLIERPAISRMLNEGLRTKLTVVAAPGGYGKTTALSQWVHRSRTPVAWISLDPQDNDLIQFWNYAIAALDRIIPHFAEALSPSLSTLSTEDYEFFVMAFVHKLSDYKEQLVLVLDDFHSIGLSSIHATVVHLLEWLPAHVHLYVASRAELPFEIARMKSIGQVVTVTVQDLRFQLDEGVRYYRECMGFKLPEEKISMLINRTEGWVSGLHLAAISLKRSDDPIAFIHAFSGADHNISDYLFQEVLSRQSEEMRSFLLETSVLNRMNDSLCEAVTGLANTQELLERLGRLNLFIVPLDSQREWYRYHHLFSEFLRRYLRKKHPKRLASLHQRAAGWLEDHGFIEESVEQCLTGELYFEAASMLEKHLLVLKVRSGVLLRWFRELPDYCLADKPGVQLVYVKVLIEADEWVLVDSKLRNMEDRLSEPEWQPYVGTFLYLSAMVAFYRRDFKRTDEYLEKFDQLMPEGSYIQMIEANTYTINFVSLVGFFEDWGEAEQFFHKWITVWEKRVNYPFVGFFYVAYSEILYEWNRLDEAEMYLERVLLQRTMQPYGLIQMSAAIFAARIRLANDDAAEAFGLLKQAKDKLDSPDKNIFIQILDAEHGYLSFANGSLDEINAWLQTCGLQASDPIPLNQIRKYNRLARALIAIGRAEEAIPLLERIVRLLKDEVRLQDRVKATLLQGMAYHRIGDTTNALSKLEAALQKAEPAGLLRSFIEEGKGAAELLSLYLDYRQRNVIGHSTLVSLPYVKKLLLLMKDYTDELSISTTLTKQELRIVQMIGKGMSNKQIAEQNQVKVETVKSHLKNIYRKLDVNTRWHALQRGKELKLL